MLSYLLLHGPLSQVKGDGLCFTPGVVVSLGLHYTVIKLMDSPIINKVALLEGDNLQTQKYFEEGSVVIVGDVPLFQKIKC